MVKAVLARMFRKELDEAMVKRNNTIRIYDYHKKLSAGKTNVKNHINKQIQPTQETARLICGVRQASRNH